ncbi:MAG: GNAT family N-acetyltransferase [Lachnoclostridium sp.]|nr:GNAT family N-acetyltransferase [Lachnoclostridium sp.]
MMELIEVTPREYFDTLQTEWTILRYRGEDARLWDKIVSESRQGTMLHFRGYMDYHADRFQDCSLIACRRGKPIAILPANRTDGNLYSHQGLTYGGWLTPKSHFDGADMLSLFETWLRWCRDNGINRIFYKPIPHIYHRIPAEEDIYALFRFGASPWVTNLSSVIDMRNMQAINTQQKRYLKKSTSLHPWIRETQDVAEFMPVLERCLAERHGVVPVHTCGELQQLKDRFPEQIRIFLCGTTAETEAVVCMYDTAGVAHCQYIATTEMGRRNGTLTFLFHHLITETFAGSRYFDFGISNEDAGRILNSGLLHQKTGLGGRGITYSSFILST